MVAQIGPPHGKREYSIKYQAFCAKHGEHNNMRKQQGRQKNVRTGYFFGASFLVNF